MSVARRLLFASFVAFLWGSSLCSGGEESTSCVGGDNSVCDVPKTTKGSSGGGNDVAVDDRVEGSEASSIPGKTADEDPDSSFEVIHEDMKHYSEELGDVDGDYLDDSSWTSKNFIPVFLIPSLAGTRLRTWSRLNCGTLASFHPGGTVWLDLKRMMVQTKCWIKCLKLRPVTQEDDGCMTRPDEGVDAVSQVDETVPVGGFLLKSLIQMLASLGYEPEQSLFAHPYDWRLPPGKLEDRDAAFSRLRRRIEGAVATHKKRNPETPTRGVMLVGLSLGNLFIQYFFEYLRAELGERGLERWADEYVHGLVLGGAPFLGAAGPIKSILAGETMGLPWTKEQSRDLYLTWGVFPWMFPFNPKSPNPRHAAMNHGEYDHPAPAVEVTLRNGTVVRPENGEIVRENGFFGQMGDKALDSLQQNIDKWYIDDPVIGGGSTLRPFTPPRGIDNIICAYGVNVPTEVGFKFQQNLGSEGFSVSDTLLNHGGDVFGGDGQHILPRHRRFATRKSGDGTVPYYSLSWCHSWFGQKRVNITRVPAHKKYEEDDVERYMNVDMMDRSVYPHGVGNRTSHGHNTFFSQKWVESHPETGLQRMKTIHVWELDGIIHKDTLTDERVTHLFQQMISKGERASRLFVRMRRRMIRNARKEIDKSGVLEENWLTEIAKEGAHFSRHDAPSTDGDCYWDYYNVECAWPRYCEYAYQLGDLSLSQSCRLRDVPLAKDDVRLLQGVESFNETFNTSNKVEWRVVYRDMRSGSLPPFIYVTLAFLSGGIALCVVLYAAFRLYRDSVLHSFGFRSMEKDAELEVGIKLLNDAVEELEDEIIGHAGLDSQGPGHTGGATGGVTDGDDVNVHEKGTDQDFERKMQEVRKRVRRLTQASLRVSTNNPNQLLMKGQASDD